MAEGLLVALIILIWVAAMAAALGGLVLWILALIEVVKYPDAVFRAAGTEKTTWVLIVVLVGSIGALIYWFGPRKKLKAAEPYAYAWASGAQQAPPQYPPGVSPPAYGGHGHPAPVPPGQGYPGQGYPGQGHPGQGQQPPQNQPGPPPPPAV